MSHVKNPFVRGYEKLHVVRTLLITYDDDAPPLWRPWHSSQARRPDDRAVLSPCLFGEDFAWIAEGRDVPDEVALRCPSHGLARAVIYAVMAEEAGQPLHLGDTYSEEAAREVLRRLRFETGFYSRSWEISSAHLSEESHDFLAQRADGGIPDDLLYVAFRIPYRPAIGVQLIATPWTDANLLNLVGLTAAHLRRKQRKRGLPESLVDVLHLAAQADVRLLIFDGDAPVLDGLPLFEW